MRVMATGTQVQDQAAHSRDLIVGQEFLEVSGWK